MVGRHVPLGFGELHLVGLGYAGERAFIAWNGPSHTLGSQSYAAIGSSNHDRLGDTVQSLHARTALPV